MDRQITPSCCCGRGRMLLMCAGPRAQHPGRWYYKCPAKLDHVASFIWCDEYHPSWHQEVSNASPYSAPNYQPRLSEHASSSAVVDSPIPATHNHMQWTRDNEVQIPLFLLLAITVVLGIVIGKLF